MDSSSYVLDANVLIEAAKRYYPFDLAPGFWRSLVSLADQGRVCSIDRVKHELKRGNNEVADWLDSEFSGAFVSTNRSDIVAAYRQIMNWVYGQGQFRDEAKTAFADGADGWLVAYAKVEGACVVTQEVSNPDIKRRVPIPNVCEAFDVRYVNTFEMLRELGVQIG